MQILVDVVDVTLGGARFLGGICFLPATPTVEAWNKPGHMVSAAFVILLVARDSSEM